MSLYNFQGLGRFLRRSFWGNRETHYRLSLKRLGVLLLAAAVYLPVELVIWASLGWDEVFFRGYRRVKVKEPVFIIGNPRSGTTFFHRLLSRDQENFISMKTWEIFLAPSVSLRKLIRGLVKVIRTLGIPLRGLLRRWERELQEDNVFHKLRIRGPEEDEYLWIHIFSALKIWSFAAMLEETDPYIYYDSRMDPAGKERMMDFYHVCLQRHLYACRAEEKHYLAKNPNFSPMVDTLLKRYPSARFIYLVRNPLEAVPSHLSLKEAEWQLLGNPLRAYASRDFILDASQHWYTYPLDRLEQLPREQYAVVKFEDLVENVHRTVTAVYRRLGLEISDKYENILKMETRRARRHSSEHEYSLAEMGLSPEGMSERFAGVFDRFEYELHQQDQKKDSV